MLGSSWQDGWTAWQVLSVMIHIGRKNTAENFSAAFASLDECQHQKLYKYSLQILTIHAQR
jgi:hypothetical protein